MGLAGHIYQLVRKDKHSLNLLLSNVPVFEGAKININRSPLEKLYIYNKIIAEHGLKVKDIAEDPLYPLLFDPGISGGIIGIIPPSESEACLNVLRREYPFASEIGQVGKSSQQPAISVA